MRSATAATASRCSGRRCGPSAATGSTLESDLRRALDRGEIKVLFQPIVRLEDRTIAGFEALLRWDHPRLGRLRPQTFIPIAEETGLIVDLGVFALERTARELAAWQRALEVEPPIFASVNVSSRQLLRHDLLHDVKTVLARTGVHAGLAQARADREPGDGEPGIRGADAAAHPRPRRRPVARRFRHRLFVAVLSAALPLRHDQDRPVLRAPEAQRAAARCILRSIVKMAHELGMEVVAEGAETESDAIELYQIGCEYAQGWAFGEPMSALQARQLVGAAPEAA